jgi:type VI secretion system protein ImpJ
MSHYRKVVWNEGMLLTPHHLQQWDNYFEDQITSRLAAFMPYEWGVINLQVNHESISNGVFELIHCQAIMPDGLLVNLPQPDPLPEARTLTKHFDTTTESVEIYLAIATKRVGSANFQAPSKEKNATLRYSQTPSSVVDETTGESEPGFQTDGRK